MGEVRANIILSNLGDVEMYERGFLKEEAIRKIELDALVDTGATELVLPQDVVETLGLKVFEKVIITLANDQKAEMGNARSLLIKVCNRTMVTDCLVSPPLCEPLIGQIILERLDLIVNPREKTLTVNPLSPFLPSVKLK
jgi:clan AA aspartic protease